MINNDQLNALIKRARETAPKRKFTQSAELTLVLKDIDVKKGFSLKRNSCVTKSHKKRSLIMCFGWRRHGNESQKGRCRNSDGA